MGVGDRTSNGTPAQEMPEATGQVKPVAGGPTLASRLVPVVDRVRQLYTRFGTRPYRVFLVHVKWSGTRLGEGTPMEISRRELLPTPRIVDMAATSTALAAVGLAEEGGLSIDQISAKYTEDDLTGKTPDLQDPVLQLTGMRNAEFFYEVVENRPSNPSPTRRRYVPNGVPSLSRDGFMWRVSLTKQDFNRARDGSFTRRGP